MPIPDYQSIMLPLLRFAADKQEHSVRETIEALAGLFGLTADERNELLPSGQQAIFDNRVAWATTYTKKAELITATKKAHYQVTGRGLSALAENPAIINSKFLRRYSEFTEFQNRKNNKKSLSSPSTEEADEQTPEESIEVAYQRLRNDLATELLQQIMQCSPTFFERLVVDLIVRMGYGGSRKDAGQAVGRSNDGGIDGIIKEDRLGLDAIFIQAKRWESVVGRPEIQKFVGALQGQRARKGIFITTSAFTDDAKNYVSMIETKVVLIDGETMANYMIDFNVGISSIRSFEIKRIDSDYFTDI